MLGFAIMKPKVRAQAIISILVAVLLFPASSGAKHASDDACAQTAAMRVYSNAFYHDEPGDLLGYELAVRSGEGDSLTGLLYNYQGVYDDSPVPLSGSLVNGKLLLSGDWTIHTVEQPSKRDVVETEYVKVNGRLNSSRFRGVIEFADAAGREKVELKRAPHLWGCPR
jgi:hypothetical protein